MRTRIIVAVLGIFLLFLTSAQAADKHFILAHYNDLHAAWMGTDNKGQACLTQEQAKDCLGGVGRIKTVMDRLRAGPVPVFLLDAGDEFEGTPFYSLGGGKAVADILNRLQVDAMVVGNHDFTSYGRELGALLDHTKTPVLAANVTADAPCPEAGRLKPSVILDRGESSWG